MKKALSLMLLFSLVALLLVSCASTSEEVVVEVIPDTFLVSLTFVDSTQNRAIPIPESTVPKSFLQNQGIAAETVIGITFSDTIQAIGENAFSGCTLLQTLVIPDGVKSIASSAFRNNSIKTLTLPCTLAIKLTDMFPSCSVVNITGKGSIKSTLSNHATLVTVEIGDEVTDIAAGTFSGCTSLTSVKLGQGIACIGEKAFAGTKIASINLPAQVSSVEIGAFQGAGSLTAIEVEEANTVYQSLDGNLYSKDGSVFFMCPEAMTGTVDIRQGTVKIADQALYGCAMIEQAILHGNVKGGAAGLERIGASAFQDCSKLTEITMPDSITSAGSNAFFNCTALASVRLSANLKAISDRMFMNCRGIPFIDFPASVTSIGVESFYGCSGLDGALTIPGTIISVGDSAFFGCSQVDLLLIKEGVKSLGEKAFAGCEGLTVTVIPSTLAQIGSNTFENDLNITSVSAPYWITDRNSDLFKHCRNVTITGKGAVPELAFKGNESLVNIIIDPGITEIGRMSFMSCTAVESISLPGSVSRIMSSSFYGCSKLENLKMDMGISRIDDSAFAYCASLKHVSLPSSLTYVGSAAFAQCSKLFSVAFPLAAADIDKLALSDTNLGYIVFSTDLKTPVGYPWGNIHTQIVNQYFELPEVEEIEDSVENQKGASSDKGE